MPTIIPRRSGGNAVVRIVRLSGRTAAAPSPCTVRATISSAVFGGERARGRGQREQRQADVEDPAPAEPVAERGGGDDAGGEGDAVGVDRPLQGREAGVQVALHARQRGDHDHRVEDHHEVRGRGQAEHPPQRPTRCRVRSSSLLLSSWPPLGRFCLGDERTTRRTDNRGKKIGTMSVCGRAIRLVGEQPTSMREGDLLQIRAAWSTTTAKFSVGHPTKNDVGSDPGSSRFWSDRT